MSCSWDWHPTNYGTPSGEAKRRAKSHVQSNPTHHVIVTARTDTEYYA